MWLKQVSSAPQLGEPTNDRVLQFLPHTRKIIESMDELVAVTRVDGFILYANQNFLDKLAIPATLLNRGRSRFQVNCPERGSQIAQEIRQETIDHGTWLGECELHGEAGTSLPVRLKTGLIRGEAGNILGIYYVASDLSATWENERQLQLLSSIVQCSSDAIMGITPKGIVFSWNKEAENLFGYSAKEFLGKSWEELLSPEQRREATQLLSRVNRGERIPWFETTRLRRDGTPVHVATTLSPILNRNQDVMGCSVAARDITAAWQMESQYKHALKLDSISRLAGGVAHEFNNVHSIILGYCDIISELCNQEPRVLNAVSQIKKATNRATTVTQQLLAFSRKQILEPRVIDLAAIVAGLENLLRKTLGDDVDVIITNHSPLGHIKADPGQVEEVIMKLAVNGREAMPTGGKLFISTENVYLDETYALGHKYIKPGEYCLLTISDNGSGMDHITKSHLFEPFFTTKENGAPAGMGLAVVYGIVKQSGGYIHVYTELGLGTTFRVYLPRVNDAISQPQILFSTNDQLKGKETVLLVDDDNELRKVTHHLLESLGYKVLEATGGQHAIEIANQYIGKIHLLLTDVVMPMLNGPTLAKQLEILYPGLKVIYMSGYTNDLLKYHLGPDSKRTLLVKPFTKSALAMHLRQTLGEPCSPTSSPDHVEIPKPAFALTPNTQQKSGNGSKESRKTWLENIRP